MANFDQIGNDMPAPGYRTGPSTVDDELLFSYSPPPLKKGVTLKPGQGILRLGTALAYDSASKKYVKTTVAGDVKGFLVKTVDTGSDSAAQVFLANIFYAATMKLSAVQAANSGLTLSSIAGAKVESITGFFKF